MLLGPWQGFDKLANFCVTTLIYKGILQNSKRKAKNHLEKIRPKGINRTFIKKQRPMTHENLFNLINKQRKQ